jgi:hypothetical protein
MDEVIVGPMKVVTLAPESCGLEASLGEGLRGSTHGALGY